MIVSNEIRSIYNKKYINNWFAIQSCYVQSYTDFDMDIHSHCRIEIMYANFGDFTLEYYSDGKLQRTQVNTNDFVIIDSGIPHKIKVSQRAQILNIELDFLQNISQHGFTLSFFCNADKNFNRFVQNGKDVIKLFDPQNDIYKIMSMLLDYYFQNNNVNDHFVDLFLASFLTAVVNIYHDESNYAIGVSYLKNAVKFINENYARNISNGDICAVAGVSENYLNRLFKQNFGLSINEYVNSQRIKRAIVLIMKTSISLTDIPEKVGFFSAQNFFKQFKKITGATPLAYKTANMNQKKIKLSSNQRKFYWEYREDEHIIIQTKGETT